MHGRPGVCCMQCPPAGRRQQVVAPGHIAIWAGGCSVRLRAAASTAGNTPMCMHLTLLPGRSGPAARHPASPESDGPARAKATSIYMHARFGHDRSSGWRGAKRHAKIALQAQFVYTRVRPGHARPDLPACDSFNLRPGRNALISEGTTQAKAVHAPAYLRLVQTTS